LNQGKYINMSFINKIVTLLWIVFVFWTSVWLFLWTYIIFQMFFLYRAMSSESYSCVFGNGLKEVILCFGIISLVFLTFGFIWSKIVLLVSESIHGQYYSDMTHNPKFSNLSVGLSKVVSSSVCIGLLFNTVYVVFWKSRLCGNWF
jgi:hypothetical protein